MYCQGKACLGGQQGIKATPKHEHVCPDALTHSNNGMINIWLKCTYITGRKREVTLKLNGIQHLEDSTE